MTKFCLYFSLLLVFCLALEGAQAQQNEPPFWNEIQAFKKQDKKQMPPKNAILFVGSSSIRMWDQLEEMFPEQQVINRGFGGSTLLDLQRSLPDIVLPYEPKQIVIYAGENDIATGTVQAQEVLQRFKEVFQEIRQEIPQVPIVFVSIKPSPSRIEYKPIMKEANKLIRQYLEEEPKTAYVDVYSPMLLPNGKPRPDIFIQDSLHLNNKGYQIWQKQLSPYLVK
jgi:lysophospholipase L1-like esterase